MQTIKTAIRPGGTGIPCRSIIMTKAITRIEALEDNGGGLHLAVFVGESCAYFFSGFECGGARAPSMQEEIEGAATEGVLFDRALRSGGRMTKM